MSHRHKAPAGGKSATRSNSSKADPRLHAASDFNFQQVSGPAARHRCLHLANYALSEQGAGSASNRHKAPAGGRSATGSSSTRVDPRLHTASEFDFQQVSKTAARHRCLHLANYALSEQGAGSASNRHKAPAGGKSATRSNSSKADPRLHAASEFDFQQVS